MQILRVFVLAAITLVGIPACSPSFSTFPDIETEEYRVLLLGKWYGEHLLDDGTVQRWLVSRSSDGTYTVDFELRHPRRRTEIWSEFGIWGVRKPIYFTAARAESDDGVITSLDVTRHALYDAYQIVVLDGNVFTYRSYSSGNEFTVKKVPKDFTLQSKDQSDA